jgi:hypothetical protein
VNCRSWISSRTPPFDEIFSAEQIHRRAPDALFARNSFITIAPSILALADEVIE